MQEKNKKFNIAFFGTPELTIPILDELSKSGYLPKVIVTMPDRPMGRKMIITPPTAKVWALAHNVPVLQPEKIDAEFLENLKSYNVDLGVEREFGRSETGVVSIAI
jgi:methionyl-tRNA formyltransferase